MSNPKKCMAGLTHLMAPLRITGELAIAAIHPSKVFGSLLIYMYDPYLS